MKGVTGVEGKSPTIWDQNISKLESRSLMPSLGQLWRAIIVTCVFFGRNRNYWVNQVVFEPQRVMSIAYNYETAMARYSLKVRAMWRFPAPWRKTSKRNWRPWSTTDEEISVPGGYAGNCLEPKIIACKSLQHRKKNTTLVTYGACW